MKTLHEINYPKSKKRIMRITSQTSKNSKRDLELILMLFFGLLFTITVSSQIIFDNGFESGSSDWTGTGPWKKDPANVTSSNNSREGTKSVLFKVVNGQPRSELVLKNGKGKFEWRKEYWIGFSVNILDDNNGWGIINQHHSIPNSENWKCNAGSNSFSLVAKSGKFTIETATDPIYATRLPGEPVNAGWGLKKIHRPYILGEWHDFVLHFKYAPNNTGFIEIWLDGKKIVDEHGTPSTYLYDGCDLPKEPYQYQKIGNYYGDNNNAGKTLYDAFRIGKGSSVKYEDVAPGGSTLATTEFQNNIDVTISPNPTANEINIQFPEAIKVEKVSIYNVLGKEVFTKEIQISKNEVKLTPDLASGVYIVKIVSEKGQLSKKIIIK